MAADSIRIVDYHPRWREDFARLLRFVEHADIHPVIDSTFGLADARAAFAKVLSGDVFGKVVVRI